MTVQEVFDKALAAYDDAKKIISTLSDKVKATDPSFKFELAMAEFDSVLQAIMLAVAAADGVFQNIERQFVEKITQYADILSIYNAAANTNYTWDDLEKADGQSFANFTLGLLKINESIAEEFITPFAKIDKADARDYLKELTDAMVAITGLLGMIDGDAYESKARQTEYQNAANMMNALILKKWDAITGESHRVTV